MFLMNITSLIGKKKSQTQGFLQDGKRIPITHLMVSPNYITQIKTQDKDGYSAIQLGFDTKKNTTKQLMGHFKKAGIGKIPRFLIESKTDDVTDLKSGSEINVSDVFKVGDIIDVTSKSKGKGFQGGVKRHHFKGGPRTHGQSDRERAPGSIGQTTTPGRVYKGKRMAGKMGSEKVTIKNLRVVDIDSNLLLVKGLIPGSIGSIVLIKKVGEDKKLQPLYKEKIEE